MITEGQKIKFILELIRRTAKSEVIWEITNFLNDELSITDLSYKTVLEGGTFRIFKYKTNYTSIDADEVSYSYEQGKIFSLFNHGLDYKTFNHGLDYKTIDAQELGERGIGWYEKIRLELIDENNNALYEFPDDYSLITLYRVIREKTSGIEDVFERIFQKT